jgi:hypothetical protein
VGRPLRVFWRVGASLLVLVALALETVGCHGAIQPVEWSELGAANRPTRENPPAAESKPRKASRQSKEELRIVARSTTQVASLSPNDIIRIMRRIGFDDQQILDLGTDLYNALRLSGGAEVYYGKRALMIFAVQNGQIQIQSDTRGSFVYDLAQGRFVLGATPSGR